MDRTAGTYVYLYPPGIPVLTPGEQVTRELTEELRDWMEQGFQVHGLESHGGSRALLRILREE